MSSNNKNSSIRKSSVIRVITITLAILSIPLLAMVLQGSFTDKTGGQVNGVNWDITDFLVMGILIFGTVMMFEYMMNKVSDKKQRIVIALAIFAVFFLVWAELAVGIFGSPFAGS